MNASASPLNMSFNKMHMGNKKPNGRQWEATGGHERPREKGRPRERLRISQFGVPPGGAVPCSKLLAKSDLVALV